MSLDSTGLTIKRLAEIQEEITGSLRSVFGEHINAIKAKYQRNQTRFRIIAYNAYRQVTYILWSISTRPIKRKIYK